MCNQDREWERERIQDKIESLHNQMCVTDDNFGKKNDDDYCRQ